MSVNHPYDSGTFSAVPQLTEQEFWAQLTNLAVAAVRPGATPQMSLVAALLVEADLRFNGHPSMNKVR
jgi:hypothetical protein